MKRYNILSLVGGCLALALASCQSDRPEILSPEAEVQGQVAPPAPTPSPKQEGLHTEELSLSVEDEEDALRAVRFVQKQRTRAGREAEVTPRLELEVGSTHLLYLNIGQGG